MTNYEAATMIFQNMAYGDNGKERNPEETRAFLMAIWALMEQAHARYE